MRLPLVLRDFFKSPLKRGTIRFKVEAVLTSCTRCCWCQKHARPAELGNLNRTWTMSTTRMGQGEEDMEQLQQADTQTHTADRWVHGKQKIRISRRWVKWRRFVLEHLVLFLQLRRVGQNKTETIFTVWWFKDKRRLNWAKCGKIGYLGPGPSFRSLLYCLNLICTKEFSLTSYVDCAFLYLNLIGL